MSNDSLSAADRGSELSDQLGLAVNHALFADECQRLAEWALIGPVQRAALESFAERLLAAERERCAKIVDMPPDTEAQEVIGGEEGLTMLRELAAQIRGA